MALHQKIEDNASQKALRGLAKILAIFIILGVSAFGDVIYILEIQSGIKGAGLLVIACYIGAMMGFFATCYLLLGKTSVFAPGSQMLASWIVFVMELVIVALNIMYVFDQDHTGVMAAWGYISCATPIFHMVGVWLIFMLDPENKRRHRVKEMQEKEQEKADEFEHIKRMAQIEMREIALGHFKKALAEKSHGQTTITTMDAYADEVTSQLLTEMSGKSLPPPKDDRRGDDRGFGRFK